MIRYNQLSTGELREAVSVLPCPPLDTTHVSLEALSKLDRRLPCMMTRAVASPKVAAYLGELWDLHGTGSKKKTVALHANFREFERASKSESAPRLAGMDEVG